MYCISILIFIENQLFGHTGVTADCKYHCTCNQRIWLNCMNGNWCMKLWTIWDLSNILSLSSRALIKVKQPPWPNRNSNGWTQWLNESMKNKEYGKIIRNMYRLCMWCGYGSNEGIWTTSMTSGYDSLHYPWHRE